MCPPRYALRKTSNVMRNTYTLKIEDRLNSTVAIFDPRFSVLDSLRRFRTFRFRSFRRSVIPRSNRHCLDYNRLTQHPPRHRRYLRRVAGGPEAGTPQARR
jgi:hypothetical protein